MISTRLSPRFRLGPDRSPLEPAANAELRVGVRSNSRGVGQKIRGKWRWCDNGVSIGCWRPVCRTLC